LTGYKCSIIKIFVRAECLVKDLCEI
jgi:hypothetical protein